MKTSYESAVAPVPAVHVNVASKATSVEASAGEAKTTHVGGSTGSFSVVKLFTAQLLEEPPALFAVTDQK